MAFYRGYFDESGGDNSRFLVVAGLIGAVRDWCWFEEEWKMVLASEGVTGPFHMQHLEKDRKAFRGWEKRHRERLLGRLLAIIKNRACLGVASAVSMEDYNSIITPGDLRNQIGSAYTLCVQGVLWCAGRWAQRTGRFDEISYVLDAGHRNSEEAREAHDKTRTNEQTVAEYRVGPLAFDTDDRTAPLQAADLVAYETWKHLTGKSEEPNRRVRYTFAQLLKLPYENRLFDRQPLQEMRDQYARRPR
jgi:hypothetical protein